MTALDNERWKAHRREHKLEAHALTVASSLQNEALRLAALEVDRRLEGMNDLRSQLTNERNGYLTRLEYESKHDALVSRVQTAETLQAGLLGRISVIAALSGLLVSVAMSLVLRLIT